MGPTRGRALAQLPAPAPRVTLVSPITFLPPPVSVSPVAKALGRIAGNPDHVRGGWVQFGVSCWFLSGLVREPPRSDQALFSQNRTAQMMDRNLGGISPLQQMVASGAGAVVTSLFSKRRAGTGAAGRDWGSECGLGMPGFGGHSALHRHLTHVP